MKLLNTILFNLSMGLAFLLLSSFGKQSKGNSQHQIANVAYYVIGQVKDCNTGEPIIGVTVKVKSTTNGTLTNLDGNYSIAVQPNSVVTLVFSRVGYTAKETIVAGGTGGNQIKNICLTEWESAVE